MSEIIRVNQVSKIYDDFKAVNNISFTLDAGKIYGLLGRNGAGKTTLMHMLTAQQLPSQGEVKVFGEVPFENNRVLKQICFIKESQKYPDVYNVKDVLEVAPDLFSNWDADYAAELVEQFRLPLKRTIKKLSRGQLSSVGIVIGLASRAPLTIFDEPYLGLDAVARELFYDQLLADYALHPRTIILSTHLIDEVSRMLEHILLLDNGELLLNEDAEALRGRAYTVVGPGNKIEAFCQGKDVMKRQNIGGISSATILAKPNSEEQQEALALKLELQPVSLQELMVRLTGEAKNKEANAL